MMITRFQIKGKQIIPLLKQQHCSSEILIFKFLFPLAQISSSKTSRLSPLKSTCASHMGQTPLPSYSVMLQDQLGFTCEMHLPQGCEGKEPWKEVVEGGEGNKYQFIRLRVGQRITRTRYQKFISEPVRVLECCFDTDEI